MLIRWLDWLSKVIFKLIIITSNFYYLLLNSLLNTLLLILIIIHKYTAPIFILKLL